MAGTDDIVRFLEAAERIRLGAGLNVIEIGVVHLLLDPGSEPVIVSFQGSLTEAVAEDFEEAEYGPRVGTVQATVGASALADLVDQMSDGSLSSIGGRALKGPLSFPESISPWQFQRRHRSEETWCAALLRHGNRLREWIPSDVLEAMDDEVVQSSKFAFASLARLVHQTTGSRDSPELYAEMSLAAPWPLQSMTAARLGRRLRIDVQGLPGLDTNRFFVNLEGDSDRRVEPSEIKWSVAGTNGKTDYVGIIDQVAKTTSAVNVLFQGLPEVREHCKLQREVAWPLRSYRGPYDVTEHSGGARIRSLRVSGYRALRSIPELDLDDLTVLIGLNEAGKSTILEVFGILSSAASGRLADAVRDSGGMGGMMSRYPGTDRVCLGVTLEIGESRMRYDLVLMPFGAYDYEIVEETLTEEATSGAQIEVVAAGGGHRRMGTEELEPENPQEAILSQLPPGAPPAARLARDALRSIRVHNLAVDDMEPTSAVGPGSILAPAGGNLVAVLQRLSASDDWPQFLEVTKLAFPTLHELRFPAHARGAVRLEWVEKDVGEFGADELSDGVLYFLATLAAMSMPGASLVAIDEPEMHLHPGAILRLLGAAISMSGEQSILLTTQSDAVLRFLDEHPEVLRIVRRSGEGTVVVAPDPGDLAKWASRFRLDEIRGELETWDQEK